MRRAVYAIVGARHQGAENLVKSLDFGEPITLRRDPNNRFDRNAVEVWARKTHIGYVPRGQAAILAKLMDAAGKQVAYGVVATDRVPSVEVDEDQLKKGGSNVERSTGPARPGPAAEATEEEGRGEESGARKTEG